MKFTEDHEWITIEGDIVTIGITEHASEQLGDVVFVELPEVGADLSSGDGAAVIESVKAASDILAPLDGEVTEVNDELTESPDLVNSDPLSKGWFFKMKIADAGDLDEFMDENAYKEMIA